jgi:C-terminal processing protease CtpA/Prc
VEAVLEASPTAIANAKTNKNLEFEFSVREITEIDKVQNRWAKDQQGLLTIEVTRGGWAQMSGLKADDLILSINGQSVTNVTSFESVMKQVMKAQPKVIKIFVRRDYRTHFIFIEPDWAKLGDGK